MLSSTDNLTERLENSESLIDKEQLVNSNISEVSESRSASTINNPDMKSS